MSPHNYSRFNGSNINATHSYHSAQNELGLAMGRLTDTVYNGLFKYSGLHAFYNSRLFSRGFQGDRLSDYDKLYTIYTTQDPNFIAKP